MGHLQPLGRLVEREVEIRMTSEEEGGVAFRGVPVEELHMVQCVR